MKKSLLELLEEEKRYILYVEVVKTEIEYAEKFIQQEKEKNLDYPVEHLDNLYKERVENLKVEEEKLLSVRKEIKKYIDFLGSL